MTAPDATMARIGEAVALAGRGERAAARELLAGLWAQIGAAGEPLHRCALAHSMADLQDDVREELDWDLRALQAAEMVSDDAARHAGATGPAAAFFPSLHLNVADCHRRLGDHNRAREHLELGRAAASALPDDGYGRMIRGGLERLADRLGVNWLF